MKLYGKILIILLLINLSFQQKRKSQQIFKPSWLNYIKNEQNDKKFIISNPLNAYSVHLNTQNNKLKAKHISINSQNIWKSTYQQESNLKIQISGKGAEGIIQVNAKSDSKISFFLKKEDVKKNSFVYVSSINLNKQNLYSIHQKCVQISKTPFQIKCDLQSSSQVYFIVFSQTQEIDSVLKMHEKNNNSGLALEKFMKIQKIIQRDDFTFNFVQEMLTNSLSSICYEQSEYEGLGFYGLCSNSIQNQIEKHYSLLVLDILFNYNQNLSMWLVENFLNLLEEKLFYSFRENEWISIPEHTQVFKTYLKALSRKKYNLTQNQLQERKKLVIHVQNGFLNNLLLSQVNHLSEQINYRQSNTIHPTLMKMLTQAWKYSSSKAKLSSVYSESFTNDFYYHSKSQKLDSSIGKMSWLLKLLYEHIDVIEKYGNFIQQQSLEQLLSLSRVINGYMLDEPRAKQGTFNSVIIQQKMKVYTRSLGYQSLLPFVYDFSEAFPLVAVYNLTTEYGLSSLPLNNQHADERYEFRGNMNLYFNYKILFSILHKGLQKPKHKIFSEGAVILVEAVQKFILKIYQKNNKNQENSRFATSWTYEGKLKTSEKYLALLNAVFMKDMVQFRQQGNNKKKIQIK